jgi:hypothetical protein
MNFKRRLNIPALFIRLFKLRELKSIIIGKILPLFFEENWTLNKGEHDLIFIVSPENIYLFYSPSVLTPKFDNIY